MGISIKAYARHRSVSPAAVRKALEYGRITKEPDCTIDPVKADRDWTANTAGQCLGIGALAADPDLDSPSDEVLAWMEALLNETGCPTQTS